MVQETGIAKGMFGYDIKQVETYIKELRNSQHEKLKELKNKIIHIKMENTKLKNEMEELKTHKEEQLKSEKFMDFALTKAEDILPVIDDSISKQIKEVQDTCSKEEAVFNKKIEEFNDTIKETQGKLNSLLKAVLDSSENLNEKVKSFMETKESRKAMLTNTNVNTVEAAETPKAEPLEVELHSIIEQENIMEYINLQDPIENKEIVRPVEREEKLSLFFDDIEDEIEEVRPTQEIEKKVEEKPEPKEEPYTQNRLTANDINHIRYKYLVGKIAGEDLFGNNNKLIIAKGDVITAEVVEKVENEAKLAELIVNMVLPDIKL